MATAIFVTVFSGVVLLYQGAVSTVLQGRQAIQAFEQARGALSVLERDLKRAFTQRDAGDKYQFFGRPEGLMMVGVLPDGRLGRITYVVSPAADNTQFRTELVEPWENVKERVFDQAFEANFAVTGDKSAADAAGLQAQAVFSNPALGGYAPPPGDPMTPVTFQVVVNTQSLLRIQENIPNLQTFGAFSGGLAYPSLDPEPKQVGNSFDDFAGGSIVEGTGTTANAALYRFVLQGLNPAVSIDTGTGINPSTDLRTILWNIDVNPNTQAYAIDRTVIEAIVAGRKREAYLQLLAQNPRNPFFQNGIALWNSPAQAASFPGFFALTDRNPLDFVVSENILHSAELLSNDGAAPFRVNAGGGATVTVDALRTPGIFSYSLRVDGQARPSFNDNASIPGYGAFRRNPGPATVLDLDEALESLYSGMNHERHQATPLTPRLPAAVNAGFWIVHERPTPGSPDFRRWFTQTIEVPSAVTRTAPGRMTPNRDQSAAPVS